eukprot:gb/GECG01012336.1/.p1 GENE.gb/GECG01012336.1/~~gb/GECG01012336.1/.p1  ORF type:complete len:148 (+),score=23.00 gb/GECG01012336.1/:1-444(+)
MSSTAAQVRAGYRRLLRVCHRKFQGDEYAFRIARQEARNQIDQNKHVNDPEMIWQLVQGFDEAAEFLAANVAQGRLNERGNYEMKVNEEELGKPENEHYNFTPANQAPSDSCAAGEEQPQQAEESKYDTYEYEGIKVHRPQTDSGRT